MHASRILAAFASLALASVAAALPLDRVPVVAFPAVDAERLLAEDALRELDGPGPLRYAEPIDVAITPEQDGAWDTLPDGSRVWSLRISVPTATDLGLGFSRAQLPDGATLTLSAEGRDVMRGPYTADDVHAGELWLPVIPGDRALLELRLRAGSKSADLMLSRIGAGYRDLFGIGSAVPRPASGACNNDVICPVGDPWRAEIDSVGMWALGATFLCTGTMVMDVPGDFTPYFLSAEHCGLSAGNAPSVVVYWNFQTSTCGGAPNGSLADSQSGATFRAEWPNSDFALIELAGAPDPAFNVYWAGWDRSDTIPAGSVGIHHPSNDEKRITFNMDPLTKADDCTNGPGVDSHWFISQYEDGTTEGGSSGSGLWDSATHLFIGTLTGGTASCASITEDCYGRFARHWSGGGTPASRLSNWLDPMGTGGPTRTGSYASAGISLDAVATTDSCAAGGGDANGVTEPGESVQVRATLVATGAFTNVRGTLVSLSPDVNVVDSQATWPDLGVGVPALSDAPHFTVTINPAATCYSTADLRLDVSAAEGGPFQLPLTLDIGAALAADVPLAIPDPGVATSLLGVGQAQTVSGLRVRVQIQHAWMGDLSVELMSPLGTRVTLLDRPGAPASAFGCGDNDMDITFDDASAFDPESRCVGATPWYAGVARPVQPLSAFDGESVTGTWSLIVTDASNNDMGTILDWELLTSPALSGTCEPCVAGCPGQEIAPTALRVSKGAGQSVTLTFTGAASACATGVQMRMAPTSRPATFPGSFPADPAFADVTSQDLDPSALSFRHAPPTGSFYYFVVESLPGGAPGPSGSYGF